MSTNLRSFPRLRSLPETAPLEQYWTVKQAAVRLHVGESTVKRWLAEERLEKKKAGARTLISEGAIQTFLDRCTAGR